MTLAENPARSPLGIWLDLSRAGNFPSIWSNALAALVLSSPSPGEMPAPGMIGIVFLAGSLAYAGGTTLNDVADVAFDAIHRPERAIPRGWVARRTAAWIGIGQLFAGLGILLFAGAAPLAVSGLGGIIVAYDWLHKRWAGSVALMAGCRLMLAVSIATLPGQLMRMPFLLWLAGLFVYIVVLSVLARREYRPGASSEKLGRVVRRLLAFIPLVDALALGVTTAWIPAVCCLLAVPLGRLAQRLAASG
ncbi:MAG: UbiA family prenyltransferase [Opitutaceae bacterium]|nr:UbiA family prenyltransferase [Opitutaceae bacterium]